MFDGTRIIGSLACTATTFFDYFLWRTWHHVLSKEPPPPLSFLFNYSLWTISTTTLTAQTQARLPASQWPGSFGYLRSFISSFWLNQIFKKKIDLFTLSFSTTLHNLFPSFQLLALYFFSLLLLKAVALYLHGSVMTTNHSQFFSSIHAQVTFSHRYIHIVHGFLAVPTFLFSFYFKYLTCITWTTALSLSPCCKITLEHDFRNK